MAARNGAARCRRLAGAALVLMQLHPPCNALQIVSKHPGLNTRLVKVPSGSRMGAEIRRQEGSACGSNCTAELHR